MMSLINDDTTSMCFYVTYSVIKNENDNCDGTELKGFLFLFFRSYAIGGEKREIFFGEGDNIEHIKVEENETLARSVYIRG